MFPAILRVVLFSKYKTMNFEESISCIPKILERMEGLVKQVNELQESNSRKIYGKFEWEYYRLDEALQLIGISKAAWRRTWKNKREANGDRIIPHATYSSCTWILKSDLRRFIEKRRLK
jgi:hypothetical protein